MEGNLGVVGDAFLSFSLPTDKDGIVAPEIRKNVSKTTKEEVEDVQTKND